MHGGIRSQDRDKVPAGMPPRVTGFFFQNEPPRPCGSSGGSYIFRPADLLQVCRSGGNGGQIYSGSLSLTGYVL